MEKYESFNDVIKDRYDDNIFEALAQYISDYPHRLECDSNIVEVPDEAEMDSFDIKKISILDAGKEQLVFDIIVSAYINIYETVKRYRKSDDTEQWFSVKCNAEFEDEITNFSVSDIQIYSKSKGLPKGLLTDELVPVIEKEQFDREAEDFLKHYYPQALEKPMPVLALEVAKGMGLKVQEVHITRNASIFGKIFFTDCESEYYDEEYGIYRIMNVTKGTVFVDPKVYFMRSVGSMNNTIIHECIHWDKHKKFHDLVRMYDRSAEFINCRVHESRKRKNDWSSIDWMEWHANGIAPRVLMPAKMTKLKIEELILKNKRILPDAKTTDILESVLFELAEFFSVSKVAAKIRMIDLGYEEAIGVHTYVDDHFISNYAFEHGALQKNQTFSISALDACSEYISNSTFKAYLDSGRYLYIDGHFCINDSKYVRELLDGSSDMTDYAREHIDECCLIFDIKYEKNIQYGTYQYMKDAMYKNIMAEKLSLTSFNKSAHNDTVNDRSENIEDIRADIFWTQDVLKHMPNDFGDAMKFLMGKRSITVEELSERTMLDARQLGRMRNNEVTPTLSKVVAVCIGLNLTPDISRQLIALAGHMIRLNEKEQAYQFLLNVKYDFSIYDCNDLLEGMGIDPLTKEK